MTPGHVALTFDGGPHPDATANLLDLLYRLGDVRATFFLNARAAESFPAVARAVAAAGHQIGVLAGEREDLGRAAGRLRKITGTDPAWCRPHRDARRLGLRPVLWTCQGRDELPGASADSVYRSVLRRLDRGGILMLHHRKASRDALPAILTTCRARALRVGPLSEHGHRRIMEVR